MVDAVNFARQHGLVVAVRGGGHSIAGLSAIDGGMLIDLAAMRGVQVDAERRLAYVQGGALWGDVDRETQAFGLVAPGGVVSDTGVAGLTLGGGYGWVRRKYGLSVDALVEAQVVCADGQVRTASAESNPDLFWAIRGGGGNFGVVTSFTFALQPLGPVVGFSATFYPVEEIADDPARLARVRRRRRPTRSPRSCVTITFPANPEMPEAVHDREVAIVGGVYAGDAEEGLRVMEPLRELGTPLFDMSGPTPFTACAVRLRSAVPAQHAARLLEVAVPRRALRRRDRRRSRSARRPARAADAGQHLPHGRRDRRGRPRGRPRSPSARRRSWSRSTACGTTRPTTTTMSRGCVGVGARQGVRQRRRLPQLHRPRRRGADSAGVDTAFGRNLERLAEVKAKYDPDNFFRVNNNIEPAS